MTLRDVLVRLLEAFDLDAVASHYQDTVIGFCTLAPASECYSIRLTNDTIALLEGIQQAEVVIQAPLAVFEANLVPGGQWDALTNANIVGHGVPGDGEILNRFLRALQIRTNVGDLDIRTAGVFAMPLRHPAGHNTFGAQVYTPAPAPRAAMLPRLVADAHPEWVAAYNAAWDTAITHIRQPEPASGFVSDFIDSAFNDSMFMWDSCFMTMFGRYGQRMFPFVGTLDNFYVKQHADGFISREIDTYTGRDRFAPNDPRSTGPNVLAWAEWLNFELSQDRERLRKVFPVLVAYHLWLRDWRTWSDGSYWTSNLASGMDNQLRTGSTQWHHHHHSWVDATMQQALNCRILLKIASEIGRPEFSTDLQTEYERLAAYVNARMWDDDAGFYYDVGPDGSRVQSKSIGAFWGLLAGIVPGERAKRLLAHLDNPRAFKRVHRVPSLAADSPGFQADGGYWRGGVWSPTNYMVLHALLAYGADDLAHTIALNHVQNVVQVYKDTGTFWENYAPERPSPSQPTKGSFVGWTGLSAISIPIEFLIGIRPDPGSHPAMIWDVRLTERHGILRYPLSPKNTVDLVCDARPAENAAPRLSVVCDEQFTLRVRWRDLVREWQLAPGQHSLALE